MSVRYVLDMAEIPTVPAAAAGRCRRRRSPSPAEAASERARPSRSWRRTCACWPTAARAASPRDARVAFPRGQGGLSTTRLDARFRAVGLTLRVRLAVAALLGYATRPRRLARIARRARRRGRALDGARSVDRTRALTHYPSACRTHRRTSAPSARWRRSLGRPGRAGDPFARRGCAARGLEARPGDGGFVSLIENGGDLTLFGALTALALALAFGMIHALTPGHGKSMVAAYLVGTRGLARHALVLGGTVTISHGGRVRAGLVTLSLSQFIVPEQLYPWLNLASGVMVVAIGTSPSATACAVAARRAAARAATEDVHEHEHEHAHDHGHDHGHGHSHAHPRPALAALAGRARVSGGCCRARRRSSCCCRRSRFTGWPSAWR